MDAMDNAGVYRISKTVAIIQTVDFFTPIVDDPYAFGQIAAANSLSDVYTMGGKPVTAMNIVCFPTKKLPTNVLKGVLKGGADKLKEAGVVLIGGHSVDDIELKYGLAVTGTVRPDKLITNGGARAGDKLILTKPLGTGIISTAIKAGIVDEELVETITGIMAALNKKAAEVMIDAGANACTDVTGFGFLGHAAGLAKNSGISLEIEAASIPTISQVVDYAQAGLCPAGLFRNRDFYESSINFNENVPEYIRNVLFDPQTSGGLLISINARKANALLDNLHKQGITDAHIIGKVTTGKPGTIGVF